MGGSTHAETKEPVKGSKNVRLIKRGKLRFVVKHNEETNEVSAFLQRDIAAMLGNRKCSADLAGLIGSAKCNPEDTFDLRIGTNLAIGRLLKGVTKTIINHEEKKRKSFDLSVYQLVGKHADALIKFAGVMIEANEKALSELVITEET